MYQVGWAFIVGLIAFSSIIFLCLLYIIRYQSLYLSLLKSMLDLLSFPLWIRDKNQKIIYCNKSYASFFGVDSAKDALKYPSLVDFDSDFLRKTMTVNGQRKVYNFKQQSLLSYTIFWAIDETQTDALNNDLKRHVESYKEVLETLSAGIVIYGFDAKMKFHNQAYSQMFQLDRDWLDSSPSIGVVLDDLHSRRLLMEQADYAKFRKKEIDMAVNVMEYFEEMLHLPDGRSLRKIMAPHPMGGCFYIFEDVTKALTLERQYNTQMAVQKASLDNLYEGISVFGSDNRLRLTNPAFRSLWQSETRDLHQHDHISKLLDFIEHLFEYSGEWEDYKKKLVSRITDRVPKSVKFFRKDGKVINFTYVPLPDGSHLMTYIDVTDSHKIEQLLVEKNQLLEMTDRLKTEFINNISYELRNPLQVILGFSQLLDQESFGPLNEKQKSFVGHLLVSANGLLDLVNTIVDISTIESDSFTLRTKQVDVNKIINSVIRISRPRAKQLAVNLVVKIEKGLGYLTADEARLKQALFVLISYGISQVRERTIFNVKAFSDEYKIVFSISYDNANITNTNKSFALRLSLVRRLIELHKGALIITDDEIQIHLTRSPMDLRSLAA